MHARWMATSGGENGSLHVAVTVLGHASWLPSARSDSGEIRTEQEQQKEQKGRNMAAEDYHFNIK